MDGSSSSCFYTAEESPFTVFDPVAEMEALTMVGAEGASTSSRSEYYSARCEAMMRSKGQFSDDVALHIEFSKSHRSEVVHVETGEEELIRKNKEVLKHLRKKYPQLFEHDFSGYVLGRMIAKGGQGEVYEVKGQPNYLMKVFERGTSLQDLQQLWPLPVLNEEVYQCILYAGMLEDGRFAFVMQKCWGDLRKLIDQVMQEKNVGGIQGPPFPYKWEYFPRKTLYHVDFLWGIAKQMENLHKKGVFHRDLKASNILLNNESLDSFRFMFHKFVLVADFECSIGVLGTGFWRAPEILLAQKKRETISNEQWEKADVYSYGMTCSEIVTGRIPFDGELSNTKVDRQLVIDGKRPKLPSDLDEGVKDLITACWAPNPILRPTFSEIVVMVENIPTRQCQFRLFGIDDELPPQYHLATVQEVEENPIAFLKAMSKCEIANLANGYFIRLVDDIFFEFAGIGIVERVVLLGTPQTLDQDKWESVRKVVAGRFVNGFSTNDWVLGVVYRANFMSQGLAGLQAVDVHGIENVDLSEMVDGHTSYLTSLKDILQGIDIDSFYATQPHKLHMSAEDKKNAASTAAGPAPQ